MKEIIIAYDENTEASPVIGDWVGELVRCKDCINYGNNGCRLKRMAYQTAPDWFCADGERKDS